MNEVAVVHVGCGPNLGFIKHPFYLTSLVTTLALGIIATAIVATQFPVGSLQFYASVGVATTSFTLFTLLVMRSSITKELIRILNPLADQRRVRVPAHARDVPEYIRLLAEDRDGYRATESNYITNHAFAYRPASGGSKKGTDYQFAVDHARGTVLLHKGRPIPCKYDASIQEIAARHYDQTDFDRLVGDDQERQKLFSKAKLGGYTAFVDQFPNAGLLKELAQQGALEPLMKEHAVARYHRLDLGFCVMQQGIVNTDQRCSCSGWDFRTRKGEVRFIDAYQFFKICSPEPIRNFCTHYFQGRVTVNLRTGDAEFVLSPPTHAPLSFFTLANGKTTEFLYSSQ